MKLCAIFLLAIITTSIAEDLPSNFKTCSRSSPDVLQCLADAGTDVIISMANGIKSLKIPPIEPLEVNSITIGEASGAVSIKQEYKNIKLHGITQGFRLHDVKADWNTFVFDANCHVPRIELLADYKMDGKVLVLPIQGDGKCNITLVDLEVDAHLQLEKYEKDGVDYLKGTKFTIKLIPKHAIFNFSNLFNGDATLGDEMNKFMNENMDVIFPEFAAGFEESLSMIFLEIANNVFKVPFNTIILP